MTSPRPASDWLVLWWLCLVPLMIHGAWTDRQLSRPGPTVYAEQAWSRLAYVLAMSIIEVLMVLAVLRPASYNRSWGRAAAAFVLMLPFAAYSSMHMIHGGSAVHRHTLGVYALVVGLLVLLLISGARAAAHRWRRSRTVAT